MTDSSVSLVFDRTSPPGLVLEGVFLEKRKVTAAWIVHLIFQEFYLMKRRTFHLTMLLVLAVLMFLASGQHGSYFCVSPWAVDGPVQGSAADGNP